MSAKVVTMNREAWLTEVAKTILEPLYPGGLKGRPYRVTCGWPSTGGLGGKTRRIGECHALESSKDKVHEIFISPVLDQPLDVAGTLAHELAHVAAGIKAGHGKEFVEVCKLVGLTAGKAKSAGPGTLLQERLRRALTKLPPYPHAAIVPVVKVKAARSSNMSLVCSAEECGCRCTMSVRWLGEEGPGLPTCGCGSLFRLKGGDDD